MRRFRPGRDHRAVRHRAHDGALRTDPQQPRTAVVVGGGIAGLSAALALAERGVTVDLLESGPQFGGRAASWVLPDGRVMSRGFHAFFRQYYNLRAVLRRCDPTLARLVGVADYPLLRADGLTDSFARLPRTPPWNLLGFVRQSPSFRARDLADVNVATALELVATEFPQSFSDHDQESAAEFLDRLRFPTAARHLALEVFSRSFFAAPQEFSAGELVAMFHTYFTGSAEGLLFDVPDDHYDAALWTPLARHLTGLGVRCLTGSPATAIHVDHDQLVVERAGARHAADAVVLAADPATTRALVTDLTGHHADTPAMRAWRAQVGRQHNAPEFAVWRLWLDRPVAPHRQAFLGTTGFGPLDNVSVLERFEATAADWAADTGGSVVELHAYAVGPADHDQLRRELRTALDAVYPETRDAEILADAWLVRDDCPLIGPGRWTDRPGVDTPHPGLVLAGDWVRTDHPVALMERAATTGLEAANRLLAGWGLAGHDLWTVNPRGLLPRGFPRLPQTARRRASRQSLRSA
ncbi:FAD-dependent oxidoreductase [Propionibacteriaceae bacterium Y1700]|uniref:FAD-dependent oxidoreductase n=1 Tax=Microlunatus sp. Y1700 TaxID=3418487 RepID=UPI003DA76211